MHDLEGKIAYSAQVFCTPTIIIPKPLNPKMASRKVRTVLIVAPPEAPEKGLKSWGMQNDGEEPQRRWDQPEEWEMG